MKSFTTLIDPSTKAVMSADRRIKQVISQIVSTKTMDHIEFCRVEGGRLRITIDSAVWIPKLRFSEKQLISAMRERHFDTHTISYHVSPELRPVVNTSIRLAEKASGASAAMEAAANAVADPSVGGGDGDKLRHELLKLAKTLRSG